MEFHDFAVGLVKQAGERLKIARLEKIEVLQKGTDERDVVTAIDFEIDAMLRAQIEKTYPEHAVFSEEKAGEASGKGYEWVFDPIDGTANFSRGIPHFAVCVALLKDNMVITGAVYNPVTDELFSFEQDKGVFLNGKEVRVSSITEPGAAQGIIVIGHKALLWDWGAVVYRSFLEHLKKLKAFGSSSLDLCFLAAGRADIVVYGTLSTRDIVAAISMVRAAGGEVYTLQGTPVSISTTPQQIIATANKALFEKVSPHLHIDLLPS